jgi:hypothetical protein
MEKFKITEGTDGKKWLIINSLYPKECCDFAVNNNIKNVKLYPGYYTHVNLEPILPLKDFLEGLLLNEEVEFDKIHQFDGLIQLGALDNKKNTLDLASFPKLETLACCITKRLVGLETRKNLTSLTVSNYNPESANLAELPRLDLLECLSIIKSKVETLNGVERFKKLKNIKLFGCPTLETIESLRLLSDSLEEVSFETCKKIRDFEVLGTVRSLGKIQMTNSGSLKSLSFVKALTRLKFISFVGTNVIDGNMAYCEGIEYVGFDDKRHYTHKMEHFK